MSQSSRSSQSSRESTKSRESVQSQLSPVSSVASRQSLVNADVARTRSVESRLHKGGVKRSMYSGRRLAVFTSGGDSQGMNAALRSVVRMGLYLGCKVYFIREGYQGMVDGGDNIVPTKWNSVTDIIQKGGTVIGSARCKAFRTREGRLKAAENLLKHQITNLVCIGGDGSLTGAHCLRQEWANLVDELIRTGRIPSERVDDCGHINIVGLVGSIDNDFCGTDMTIGADTALHRIVEAVDAVTATAHSHQRSFVVEVMGRHCGYLAMVAGLATEADWIFIPEWPARIDWAEVMCGKMEKSRRRGQRTNIIIVAEGAIDVNRNAISAEMVKQAIVDRLKFDTRVTVLGHVQRGGAPSAFDRVLGCRMGAEAVMALMEMGKDSESCIVALDGNQMVRVPLMQCVERTKSVVKAMEEKNFELAAELRGRSFQRNLEMYKLLTKIEPPVEKDNLSKGNKFNLAVMNVGPPSCGMNAAVWSFVRLGLYHNCKVFGIENSFDGLIRGHIKELKWMDVAGWVGQGGSKLGTKRQTPERLLEQVASALATNNIHGLLIVGGFDAFESAFLMANRRRRYKAFCIPIVVVPATISNNVPGSCFSLGADSSLNEICRQIDTIKQSAAGTKNRVFVIETMGGYCGYLATLSALATGADNAYIFEEKFGVKDMMVDVDVMIEKLKTNVRRYLVTCSENANRNYTSDFIHRLYAEEGKDYLTVRRDVLGHAQEGGNPSPFDRIFATKFAARAVEFLVKQCNECRQKDNSVYTNKADTVVLLGIVQRQMLFTPVMNLFDEVNFDYRLPRSQWWLTLRPLLRILARHESNYEAEAVEQNSEEHE